MIMNKCIKIPGLLSLAAGLVLLSALAHAQVPQLMNYQGVLKDGGGTPIDGTVSVVFAIYDASTGGTALWSETQSVSVTGGLFNVLLGSATALPASVFSTDAVRWLGVKVGSDPEMTPRQRLVSVSYAFKAEDADALGGSIATVDTSVGMGELNLTTENGMIRAGSSTADNTVKSGRFVVRNYTNGALPIYSFGAASTATNNFVAFGGGANIGYAATALDFFTAPTTTTPTGTNRMRITGSGNVGIGTLTPSQKLQVVGSVLATSYLTSSSRTLKKDIVPLQPQDYQEIMHQINGIQMVRYLYKTESDRQPHLGVIAEDSPAEILDPAGKAVSLSDYAGYILAGLKAQAEQIQAQTAQIQAQAAQIKALTEQIKALEAKQQVH
jgi:hypothetical protein